MGDARSASVDVESWTLVNYLEEGGFPALLWDTLKDFGYTAYPEYSTREIMTTGQLLRCEVKVKISMCPTNPAWEEWECKAQGRNLADIVHKAAVEVLTTFCGKHPDEVAGSTAKVIPVPERHTVPWVEHEAFLPTQGNSHYSPDLVTSVRFFEAMYDTYRRMVGESVFYRHQIYRYRVKEMECKVQALKEARAMIATLKKERRKDKAKIQELSEIIHEQNFLLQHNDQYMTRNSTGSCSSSTSRTYHSWTSRRRRCRGHPRGVRSRVWTRVTIVPQRGRSNPRKLVCWK
jgi:hypothetical protein